MLRVDPLVGTGTAVLVVAVSLALETDASVVVVDAVLTRDSRLAVSDADTASLVVKISVAADVVVVEMAVSTDDDCDHQLDHQDVVELEALATAELN